MPKSFLIKLKAKACNIIKKETLAQVFSSECCEISQHLFYRTPPLAASENQPKLRSNHWGKFQVYCCLKILSKVIAFWVFVIKINEKKMNKLVMVNFGLERALFGYLWSVTGFSLNKHMSIFLFNFNHFRQVFGFFEIPFYKKYLWHQHKNIISIVFQL